jgi:hypothetical protein
VREKIRQVREGSDPGLPIELPEPRPRNPQLHRKTQLIASRGVLEALAVDSEVAELVGELLASPTEAVVHAPDSGPLIQQQRMQPALRLIRRFGELEGTAGFVEPVLYFMVGSMNKNVRSMALDG